MALAFHAHVISAYGGIVEGRRRLGLAPWQLRRVGDAMEAELDADHPSAGWPVSAACPAVISPARSKQPRDWRRINGSPEGGLLGPPQTRMELADIACACGFVDQSHFSRIFARVEKQSPGRWRRRLASRGTNTNLKPKALARSAALVPSPY